MAEIDENLCRHERTALERAEDTARRKEIYEALHPETKHGAVGGGRPKSRDPESGSLAFVDDTSVKTGRSRASVAEDAKIGRGLAPDIRDAIRETDLADNQSALSALAATGPAHASWPASNRGPRSGTAATARPSPSSSQRTSTAGTSRRPRWP